MKKARQSWAKPQLSGLLLDFGYKKDPTIENHLSKSDLAIVRPSDGHFAVLID